MSDMRVRIETEIFDELGESKTLIGASQKIYCGGNPLFFEKQFDELVERIRKDIRSQIIIKHGQLSKDKE